MQSSRHVRVEVNGVEVANTHKPRLLFETSLRTRTYIPKTDCRLDLLKVAFVVRIGATIENLEGVGIGLIVSLNGEAISFG